MVMSVFHCWYFYPSLFWWLLQGHYGSGSCSSPNMVPYIPNILCLKLKTMGVCNTELLWLTVFPSSPITPSVHMSHFEARAPWPGVYAIGFWNLNRKLLDLKKKKTKNLMDSYNSLFIFTPHSRRLEKKYLSYLQSRWLFCHLQFG